MAPGGILEARTAVHLPERGQMQSAAGAGVSEHPAPRAEPDPAGVCWCCGQRRSAPDLTGLGNHPEVVICGRCIRYLHRRAVERDDRDRTGLAVAVRQVVRASRASVIRRGWQQRPIVGPLLRWIDRYLP